MTKLLIFYFFLSGVAEAAQWSVDLKNATSGSVEFTAVGSPSALKINGKGKTPTGNITVDNLKAHAEFIFELESLTTGIKMRDEHMKEKYLQTRQYPLAELKIESMQLPISFEKVTTSSNEIQAEDLPFEGKLKVHGVENPVQGKVKIKRKGDIIQAEAQFETPIQSYKMDTPSFAGISITKSVTVHVQFESPFKIISTQ